jgi:hypothetical protein
MRGIECADDEAACGAAAKAILDLARDMVDQTKSCELSVEVSDAAARLRLSWPARRAHFPPRVFPISTPRRAPDGRRE